MRDLELLNWFGNFINFLIFAYLSASIINTECFSVYQMSLSAIGILASICIKIIIMTIKQNKRRKR